MTELLVEPFLGEFGWELFGWQSILRALAPTYDRVEVWHRPGHRVLYKDFAAATHPFDPQCSETNCHKINGGEPFVRPREGNWLDPHDVYAGGWSVLFNGSLQHRHIKFGEARPTAHNIFPPDPILIHARNTSKFGTKFRNWPLECWEELVSQLDGDIVSIGSPEGAHHVPGTHNLRGVDLAVLCDYMHDAELVIGPSAGPMHLAALCGAPHIVWTGHRRSPERYQSEWNPFKTDCQVIYSRDYAWDRKKPWYPRPASVLECLEAFRARLVCS